MSNPYCEILNWNYDVIKQAGEEFIELKFPRPEEVKQEEKQAIFDSMDLVCVYKKDKKVIVANWKEKILPKELHNLFHEGLPQGNGTFRSTFYTRVYGEDFYDEKTIKAEPYLADKSWTETHRNLKKQFIEFLDENHIYYELFTIDEGIDKGWIISEKNPKPNTTYMPDLTRGGKVWRYFSFTKFIAFLETKSLWFSKPSGFNDPFELMLDETTFKEIFLWRLNRLIDEYNYCIKYNIVNYSSKLENLFLNFDKDSSGQIISTKIKLDNISKVLLRSIIHDLRKWQDSFFISCWHLNDGESDAMWKLYASEEDGIAISTSFENFQKKLKENIAGLDIRITQVEYKSYTDTTPLQSIPLRYKETAFSFENEIRAYFFSDKLEAPYGKNVPIDTISLIDEIWLSPKAPEWFEELVKNILRKYRIKKKIQRSVFKNKIIKF